MIKILLVDDDEAIRSMLGGILEIKGFDVTMASNVPEALRLISSNQYQVLLSDLHMPGAGDGLTVVSAMRHANPQAVTILLSSFPEMDAAAQAILLQTDEIMVKTMNVDSLIDTIETRLFSGTTKRRSVETVAAILQRSVESTIDDWYDLVNSDEKLTAIALSREQRCSHLPQVFVDLVARLMSNKPIGSRELLSPASAEHGLNRRRQGYTAAMLVEESRMLQVSIFNTLQKNLSFIDFSVVLISVMTIADEIDSQLSQAMSRYVEELEGDALPV